MGLKRVLTTGDAAWIVAGSMIGSGIFITPGYVAGYLPGLGWPLVAWLVGGLVALAGAAVYGELGARLPKAGGDYHYLAVAYGPLWGFMNGWAAITLTFSAAAAAQTQAALEYCAAAAPGAAPLLSSVVAAPLVVLLLTLANTAGARVAGRATLLLTALPLAVLGLLFMGGILTGRVELVRPERIWHTPQVSLPLAFGMAIIPIFFTYSGWNAASYLAGEMKRPGRTLGRGLVLGTVGVTLAYMLINLVLLLILKPEVLVNSSQPAADAAGVFLGPLAERVLSAMVAIAILGSANVTLMAGARIYYAMATDGLAPRGFVNTNRSGVPSVALWVGGAWSALLTVFGGIQELVDWATLAILLLSSMSVTTLFVLRRRDPASAEFPCPGYPLTPVLYLAAALGAAVASYRYNPVHAARGLAIIAAGAPIYFIARRWFSKSPGSSPG